MILDILFPPTCVGCSQFGRTICASCFRKLTPTKKQVCPYCFRPSILGKTHTWCEEENGLDGSISLTVYRSIGKKIVKQMKYRLAYRSFKEIAKKIPAAWLEDFSDLVRLYPEALIQPVPLHKNRYKKRGFNQSEIIAQFFQTACGLQVVDYLERVKDTLPQVKMKNKKERYNNMKGSFCLNTKIYKPADTIILVDDLFTTGSTAKSAAAVLKQAGTAHVFIAAFAHG